MRISAFCTAVLAYVVIGHAPPAAAQVDQQRAQYYSGVIRLWERIGLAVGSMPLRLTAQRNPLYDMKKRTEPLDE
jgi:hypothetical protein